MMADTKKVLGNQNSFNKEEKSPKDSLFKTILPYRSNISKRNQSRLNDLARFAIKIISDLVSNQAYSILC